MGIKDLWDQFRPQITTMRLAEFLSTLDSKRVAIDVSIFAYSCYAVAWSRGCGDGRVSQSGCIEAVLLSIDERERLMRTHNVESIWCFDGDKDIAKTATAVRISDSEKSRRKMLTCYWHTKRIANELDIPVDLGIYECLEDDVKTLTQAEVDEAPKCTKRLHDSA